jgi:hypothetical protein
MRRILALSAYVLFFSMLASATANAGKNAGGALIVHTDDNVSYTHTGQYCGAQFSDPGTCENAVTRTDKDENTPALIWLLAAFPDTANPAVSVVYFGIEHNLPPNEGYFVNHGYCGPAGTIEVPDGGWPETGFGNSLAFGSPVQGDILFPTYWFAVYGTTGSYLGTAENPTGGYAAFVDDSNPPVQESITQFGTVRWFAPGENSCPSTGAEDGGIDPPGDGQDQAGDGVGDGEGEEWLDGDGERQWVRDCVLARLREDLPMPPRDSVDSLGITAFDDLCRMLSVIGTRRLLVLGDDACSDYPIGSRLVRIDLVTGSDEVEAAKQFRQLPEVVWAIPDYVFQVHAFDDPYYNMQWYLGPPDPTSCLPNPPDPPAECCAACDIDVQEAWNLERGNSSVTVAFLDSGADMQHPDLFDAYKMNPGEDDGDGIVELCPVGQSGDIGNVDGQGDADDDNNGVADDILLGWNMGFGQPYGWRHPPYNNFRGDHGTQVAGLLGGITNNDWGIASVAGGDVETTGPGIELIQFSLGDRILVSGVINAFYYAEQYGACIFSSSVFIPLFPTCCFDDGGCTEGYLTEQLCLDAGGTWVGVADVIRTPELGNAMLFVVAAGNGGTDQMENAVAQLAEVMAVGGYDCKSGGRWEVPPGHGAGLEGSDYGPSLSVMGPTDDPLADNLGGGYERMVMASTIHVSDRDAYLCDPPSTDARACFGGTSAATPIVASIAALIQSYVMGGMPPPPPPPPQLPPDWLRRVLERTAEDILCDPDLTDIGCGCESPEPHCATDLLGWDLWSGHGRVDAGRALTLPVAVIAPLGLPHEDCVLYGETVHIAWEAIDINSSNGWLDPNDPDAHFELHYLVAENGLDWHPIAVNLDPTTSSYDWVVTGDVPPGPDRRIRLTVADSGTEEEEPHVNQDYSERFAVLCSEASVSVVPSGLESALEVMPNPTHGAVEVHYVLRKPGEVRLELFDVAGRQVRTLAKGEEAAGPRVVRWDGLNDARQRLGAGVYFIRMSAESLQRSARLVYVE